MVYSGGERLLLLAPVQAHSQANRLVTSHGGGTTVRPKAEERHSSIKQENVKHADVHPEGSQGAQGCAAQSAGTVRCPREDT
jgi:hypothetical protein